MALSASVSASTRFSASTLFAQDSRAAARSRRAADHCYPGHYPIRFRGQGSDAVDLGPTGSLISARFPASMS
jgi:hypothetical protein